MEQRMRKAGLSNPEMEWRGGNNAYISREDMLRRERGYYPPLSQGNAKKSPKGNYFGFESMLLLVCLTASLLFLPLILPPLPPPPYMLLLLPIAIFGLLMILAFMPSNVRDLTNTYM